MDITTINEIKAHYQEGSNFDGSRKFTIKTPLGIFVFTKKTDARTFMDLYDKSSKFFSEPGS